MLLAFVGRARTQYDFDTLAPNAEVLGDGDVSIGAWATTGRARIDRKVGAAVEGDLAFEVPSVPGCELSIETIRGARGDFAVMAATRDGLLVASGLAGGHRPIYVTCTPRDVIASTRLERLLSALGSRPPLEPDFVAHSSVLERLQSPTLTPYAGVQKVPQGEAWLLRPGSITRKHIVRPLRECEARDSPRDLALRLREALEDALRRAVHNTARVAIAAGGGLDSSALVGIAFSLARKGAINAEIDVYNFAYDSPLNCDAAHLRALQTYLGIHATPVTAADAVADFRHHFVIDAAPCYHPVVPLWIALDRSARKKGIDVVVSGAGGDQVMEGQPILLAALARRGHPLRALRSALRLRGSAMGTMSDRLQDLVRPNLGLLIPEGIRKTRRRAATQRRYPWAGPKLRAYLARCAEAAVSPPSLASSPAERYEVLRSMRIFDEHWASRVQQESVTGNFRSDPFLDDEFLRFTATLPPLALLHGDYCRGLLREAIRGLVPETIRLREDKAPLDPSVTETVNLLGGFRIVHHLLDVRMLADLGLIEPRLFRARFDEVVHDPAQLGWLPMWAVLSAEAFLRHNAGDVEAATLG